MQKTPVILTSFGTRKGGTEVRNYLESRFRENFPDCEFYWAQSSRSFLNPENPSAAPSPQTLLHQLHEQGHKKVLIQSLHIAPATEYHKLTALCDQTPMQVRISPPLLSNREDCEKAARALKMIQELPEDVAAFLVLHGSSHEGGEIFHRMGGIFMEVWGKRAFYSVLEGNPSGFVSVQNIKRAGFSKIFLLPFMLDSEYHLKKDILAGKNSLKSLFEMQNLRITVHHKPVGLHPEIVSIFLAHLKKTLEEAFLTH